MRFINLVISEGSTSNLEIFSEFLQNVVQKIESQKYH